MGDNNLSSAVDGNIITAASVNQYKTAFSGDVIPRASDGTINDAASDLGSSSNQFKDAHIAEKVRINTVIVEGDSTNNAIVVKDSSDNNVGFVGRHQTSTTTDVPFKSGAILTGSVTGNEAASSTAYTRATITFDLDAPTMLCMSISDVSYNNGYVYISPSTSASSGNAYVFAGGVGSGSEKLTSEIKYFAAGSHTMYALFVTGSGGGIVSASDFSIAAI